MTVLRRFVAVGATATLVDFGGFLLLHLVVGWSPLVADIVAIVAASAVSFMLHRGVTFAADPSRRWYRNHGAYALAAALALAADTTIVTLTIGDGDEWWWSVLVKSVALAVAFGVRLSVYRLSMFEAVRNDQLLPVARPPAPGELRLSLVIPAYGEQDGIGTTLARVEAELGEHFRSNGGFEVVVVDDGSADDTAGAARAGADQVIVQPENRGKGAAVRAGVLATWPDHSVHRRRSLLCARPGPGAAGVSRGRMGRRGRESSAHRDPHAGHRRPTPRGRRPDHQRAHLRRAARPVSRHPVRSEGVPL